MPSTKHENEDEDEYFILKKRISQLETIQQSNASILETAVDGIIAISDAGIIEAFNTSAERMFGYQASEVIGSKVNILMPEPMRSEHDQYLDNYKHTGNKKIIGVGREVLGQRKDGSTFPLHLSVGESNVNGKRSYVSILRDITETKRFQTELIDKTNALQEAHWLKTQRSTFTNLILNANNLHELAREYLSALANLLEIGYAVFYIIDSNGNNQYKIYGRYALPDNVDNETIKKGEGLAGQCVVEKKPILLTNVPNNYIKINSGLGKANPLNIFVVPLILKDEVLGILEIASFHTFAPIQRTLLEQIASDLSIGINNILKQVETQHLFEKSNNLASELKKQHEVLVETNNKLKIQGAALEATNTELAEKTTRLERQHIEIEKINNILKKKQKEIEEKARDLEITNKYKSEFLANMSHELRTPLNSLLILANLLLENRDGNLLRNQLEALEVIFSSGNELLHLINDILDLSKVEAGKLDVLVDTVFIRNMLVKIEKLFIPIAKEKNIKFIVEIAPDTPDIFHSDGDRVTQILQNLLSNAFKFTKNGSVKLYASYLAHSDEILFNISDTGIGIEKNEQDFIFEAFRQIDGSLTKKDKGAGLGLAICAQLARLLNGTIKLQSTLNVGSTFSLTLPRIVSINRASELSTEEKRTQNTDSSIYQMYSTNLDSIFENLTGKNILLVDDDMSNLYALSECLRANNLNVTMAATGKKCMQTLNSSSVKYDMVLMDIMMPDEDGYSVIKQIRNHEKYGKIPIIVVSAKVNCNQNNLAESEQANEHVVKPVNVNKLLEIMNYWINFDNNTSSGKTA